MGTEHLGVQNEIVNGLTAKTLRLENRIDQLEDRAREQNRVIGTLIDVQVFRSIEKKVKNIVTGVPTGTVPAPARRRQP